MFEFVDMIISRIDKLYSRTNKLHDTNHEVGSHGGGGRRDWVLVISTTLIAALIFLSIGFPCDK